MICLCHFFLPRHSLRIIKGNKDANEGRACLWCNVFASGRLLVSNSATAGHCKRESEIIRGKQTKMGWGSIDAAMLK